ncbi:lipopolysaccharide biosynthesis protein [Vibrio splendidus]|uniref:lipopolysaccharide biosynthesis protein n=1 Tax=Vibrio splendidus TaxID=29497 RepID=UPI000C83E4F8|nr:oligosaccharide flippase family protein [Vibrio splendidus]PMK35815.1 hypothetical protein BCU01_22635 [Vibrio splendidus]
MKNSKVFGLAPILSAIISFSFVIYMTWVLGADVIARFSIIQVIITFAMVIVPLGGDHYFIRQFYNNYNEALSVMLFKLSIGCLMVLILSKALASNTTFDYGFFVIVCISSALIRISMVTSRMNDSPYLYFLSLVLPRLLMFILSIVLYSIFEVDKDVDSFEKIVIASYLFSCIFFIFLFKDKLNKFNNCKLKESVINSFKYSVPLCLATIVSWGLLSFDRIYVNEYLSDNELAVYSVGLTMASVGSVISSMVSILWVPIAMKLENDEFNQVKITRYTALVLCVITLVSAFSLILSPLATYFIPIDYNDVVYIFPLLMNVYMFYCLSEFTSVGINISNRTIYSLTSSLIALISLFFLLFKFKYFNSLIDIAFAVALSQFILMVIKTELSNKLWLLLPRFKIYSVAILFFIPSALYSILKYDSYIYLSTISFFNVIIVLILFKNHLKSFMGIVR